MSDNIQVSIRVRPLNPGESLDSQVCRCIQINQRSNCISIPINSTLKTFTFDYVADEDTTQDMIFSQVAKPITENCLKGYNGTVFSYGQTGSGKTHTIIGHSSSTYTDRQAGIIPRCLDFILDKTSVETKIREKVDFLVKCSFLEIYNEQIKDLLSDDSRNLQIREDIKKGCYVEDLIEESVFNLESALDCLNRGLQRRHVGSTLMNTKSSRSHSVFSVRVEAKENKADVLTYRNSVFHIIDLAGSERQKPAGTSGERLREAAMINKSLSTLGDVINSLVEIAEGKSRYVRYRDSRLTFFLKDSIGGNSKTSIIANISPSFINYAETLSTLRFAERAKLVKNRAVINEDTLETLNELKAENQRLRSLLHNNPESLPLNPRIRDLQELLAKNSQLRLRTESSLQQIIDSKENYIDELSKTIQKYEDKVNGEKLINLLKEDNIRRLKKGEKISESQVISDLRQEVLLLRRENLNHPVAAKYFVENDSLRHHIESLFNEINQAPGSVMLRLKENQEFTESLTQQFNDNLQDQKVLEIQMEKIITRNQELEKALILSEEHKNQLVFELETLKIKIENMNETVGHEDIKKTPLKLLDLNIRQGRPSRSSLNGYPIFFSPVPSPFLEFSGQKQNQNRNHNESIHSIYQGCPDCNKRDQNILNLEKKLSNLSTSYEELQYINELYIKLKDELKKTNEEIIQKELNLMEINEDYQFLLGENEMLTSKIIEISHQINEKSSLIDELSRNKQFSIYDLQDLTKLKDQNSMIKEEINKLKAENWKNSQNFLESIKNQEKTIENLRKTQENEFTLQKEVDELKVRLKELQRENKYISERLSETTQELVQMNGHRNLNQKINYLSKLKEDFNAVKDQNSKLREEIKSKNEKIELISRKYEKLAKANGIKEYVDEMEEEKEKVRTLECQVLELNEILSEIQNVLLVLPFCNEFSSLRIDLAVKQVVEHYSLELSKLEDEILELHKELQREESVIGMLEGENNLLKQKIFCMKSVEMY